MPYHHKIKNSHIPFSLFIFLSSFNLFARTGAKNTGSQQHNRGSLTRFSGKPDVVTIRDLKASHVVIEANGGSFLVNLFSDPSEKNLSKRANQ